MSQEDSPDSKIRSIHDARKKHNTRVTQASMPLEQRVLELEMEMLRVIEAVLDIDNVVYNQARVQKLLVRALTNIGSRLPDKNQ